MNSSQPNNEDHRNALPTGTQLDQGYRIESVLGHGGFGITYYAFDEDLDNYVAIKEFLPQEYAIRDHDSRVLAKSTRDEEIYSFGLKGFLQEAKNLASIHHPNVVKPLRYFKANNTAYLVMEYAEGESLDVYLEKRDSILPEELIQKIFSHLLDGLRAVHEKGLLHRDIKPSNIYLRKSASPLLIDFGAARYALGERSRSLSVCLTPGYAPYEQYSSRGKQGPWTDIYGVGASLYKCMTGKPPASAEDRAQAIIDNEPDPYQSLKVLLSGQYSSKLSDLVDAALAFKYGDRPQTLSAVQSLFAHNNIYENSKGQALDEDKKNELEFQRHLKAGKQGDADAQFNLGVSYTNGGGVKKDFVKAAKWYRKAAKQGHVNAQFNLGLSYQKGEGVIKDYVQAVDWYRKGAKHGDADAQFNLGLIFANGLGVNKDNAQAVFWFRKAAEQEHSDAQYNLDLLKDSGKVVNNKRRVSFLGRFVNQVCKGLLKVCKGALYAILFLFFLRILFGVLFILF